MFETSKAIKRRLCDPRFITRFFVGQGIDIGSGPDPLSKYQYLFPLMESCRDWDKKDGNAQHMAGVEDKAFDFVHSSHCLEDLDNPTEGLQNWLRILKSKGHLILVVPDKALYEQGVWPSTFNPSHKYTFDIGYLAKIFGYFAVDIIKLELLDHCNDFTGPRRDQTLGHVAESAIEAIVRKI